MGTPDFAVAALEALFNAGHTIVAVYCQPPKPSGRGHQVKKTPVHVLAEKLGLEVHTPKSLRDKSEQEIFASLHLDVAVVAAYGLILPLAILSAPKFGCINIHGSLLPRWRGAAPIHRALMAGDSETGITVMQMDVGLDTGDMLIKDTLPITARTTSQSLHDDLAVMGARLIVRALDDLSKGLLHPTPQGEEGMTYAAKLSKEESKIDWNKSAAELERYIRALNPWPGCHFDLNNETIKIFLAQIITDTSGKPGTLLDDQFTVACGQDALRLLSLQRPGKTATDGASLLRGLRIPVGSRL
jgi:methionyl-tRNA formyltransferase